MSPAWPATLGSVIILQIEHIPVVLPAACKARAHWAGEVAGLGRILEASLKFTRSHQGDTHKNPSRPQDSPVTMLNM